MVFLFSFRTFGNKKGDSSMDFQQIQNFITSVGFPIVCVIFMWKKITDSDEKQTQLLTELTIAIKSLTDYMMKGGKKDV